VPKSVVSIDRLQAKGLFEVAKLAFGAADMHFAFAIDDGYAGRVIASILESSQPFDNYRDHLLFSDITDNPTH